MYLQIFFYAFTIYSRDLFYMQLLDGDHKGYVYDAGTNENIKITDSKKKSKPVWLSQDPKDEYRVKIHCREGGGDVLTVKNKKDLVFLADSKDKDDVQYFKIKPEHAKDDKIKQVFAFTYGDLWITYDSKRIFLDEEKEDLKNQKFTFVSTTDNKDAEVIKFSEPEEKENMGTETGRPGGMSAAGMGTGGFGAMNAPGMGYGGFGLGYLPYYGYSEDFMHQFRGSNTSKAEQELINLKKEYMNKLSEMQDRAVKKCNNN